MNRKSLKIIEGIGWVFIIIFTLIGIGSSLNKLPPSDNSYNPGFVHYPIQTMIHAATGLIFMLAGPLQFVGGIRKRNIRIHRWLGRMFMISCVFIAFSGFTMAAIFPFAGIWEQIAIYFYGSVFLYALYRSYSHIRKKEVLQHREWIIRVFSIGIGISLIRVLISLFLAFSSYEQVEIFALTFWIGFGGTWLIGEVWIRMTRKI